MLANSDKNKVGTNASVMARLATLRSGMTPVLQKIAQRVTLDPDAVVSQSVTEVAGATDTSEASVLRFCRDLGYPNFRTFKLALAIDLAAMTSDVRDEEADDPDPIRDCTEIVVASLRQTMKLLDDENLSDVADRIAQLNRVDIVGLGGSSYAAGYANFRFISMGIGSRCYSDSHLAFVSAAGLDEKYAFIGFSESGEANETIAALLVAKDAGAYSVAITCHLRSPLARAANVALASSPLEPAMRGSLGTLAGQLLVVDVLATKVASRLNRDGRGISDQ